MKLCRKAFLMAVGIVMMTFDEFSEAIEEAVESLEEQGDKIGSRLSSLPEKK